MFKHLYRVNNQETLRKLASSAFKANKLRNAFSVVAIVLTSVLFTALFSITSNILSVMEDYTMRMVGGDTHGSFKYLTQEDYNKLKSHKSIADISYSVVLGVAENDALKKRPTEIRFSSGENNAKGTFSMPTTGALPASGNELAADTIVLKALGIPAELGQKVTLNYTLDGKPVEAMFRLVGFWEGDPVSRASQVWLSRDYVEKQLENYPSKGKDDYIGKVFADVTFKNTFFIESKIQRVIVDSGYHLDDIQYGVNWAYVGNNGGLDAQSAISLVVLIGIIGLSGYLMISNVFYISVARDIQYFGLLKTVGTTGKQIATIIRQQALFMCIIAVPVGLLAGTFMGFILTPIIFSTINTDQVTNEIVPLALIFSTVFTIVTVVVSIARPSKMAGRVSPIQAINTSDTEKNGKNSSKSPSKKASKKTNRNNSKDATRSTTITPLNLAIRNVMRHKKKAILVTLSLSLSLMILNGTFSLANSFDMDTYLKDMIYGDFLVADTAYFTPGMGYKDQETLSAHLRETISAQFESAVIANVYYSSLVKKIDPRLNDMPERLEGHPYVTSQFLKEVKKELASGSSIISLYGLDDDLLGQLEILEGKLEMDKLKSGDYVIVAAHDDKGWVKYYEVGDIVDLPNEDGATKSYEVLAVASMPYTLSVQRWYTLNLEFYFPSEVFLKDISEKVPMLTTIKVADDQIIALEGFLSDYSKNEDTDMMYKSKASLAAEFENFQITYKIVGTILGLIVAFIGIMNFSNTTITSIIARKRELAMLQSMGMTRKQMRQMLFYEGTGYIVLTAILTFTLGSFLIYLGISGLLGGSRFAIANITFLPSLLMLPILALISIAVPFYSQKMIIGKSLVESLRGID